MGYNENEPVRRAGKEETTCLLYIAGKGSRKEWKMFLFSANIDS